VAYYLQNPIYAGFEQWCHIFKRLPITPIVSIDLWNRVQRRKCEAADRKKYQAVQLRDLDQFELSVEERVDAPNVTKPKHKLT
jgi:hypothetical protein